MTACGATQSNCAFEQGFKNRFQIRLRVDSGAADDLEHVGGRRLLLQRFAQVFRSSLYLVEQPNIFDGDHGLISEGLKQGDLFIAERLHLGTAEQDSSNALTLAQQWDAQNS